MKTGLCLCGCEEGTTLSPRNRFSRGLFKGRPWYKRGHRIRKKNRWVVNPETGCWDWQLHTIYGYAYQYSQSGSSRVHKINYEKKYGSVPKGKVLDHLCKNKKCVNPDHLEIVTVAENTRRGRATKLKKEQVVEILKEINTTPKWGQYNELAKKYNVSASMIGLIARGQRWVESIYIQRTVPGERHNLPRKRNQ